MLDQRAFNSLIPMYKHLRNFFSKSADPLKKLGGNEVNMAKEDSNNDRGNNWTVSGQCVDIPAHRA
jgi:hypothetical protein